MSTVTIACRFIGETTNAVHIADFDDGQCYWLPLSQVTKMTREKEGQIGTITMTEWIAKQKGLA